MRRRDVLIGMAATATAMAAGSELLAQPRSERLWLGIQFYTMVGNGATVGWQRYSDYLGQIRQIGYDGVELAGFSGYAPDAIRRRTDSLGLAIPSVHIGFDQVFDFMPAGPFDAAMMSGAQDVVYSPTGVVQLARVLAGPTRDVGAQFAVIAGGGKVNFASVDSTLRFAEALNRANQIVRQKGLSLSWHPHALEWTPFDGEKAPFDLIVANTDASIRYELDIFWSAAGSAQAPQTTIERYADRLALFHLKDMDAHKAIATPGQGHFDFAAIRRAIQAKIQPPRYCYVERDGANTHDPVGTARSAFQYLHSLGYGVRGA